MAASYLNYSGKIYASDKLLISPNNRSFRYGDGFFETMKMMNGRIILEAYHFERLFSSLELLQFEKPGYFTPAYLLEQITTTAAKNKHSKLARIRLTVFRGDGGLYDVQNHAPNFIIQTWEMNEANNKLNENGLVIDVFKDARKACDNYSHVKSNNYLPYIMAGLWVKKNQLNDALILNSNNRVAEATIANIFIVKDGIVKTPALTEGCIGGVMRRYLLKHLREENIPVEETQLTVENILEASECFLTNAAYNLRWVKQVADINYGNRLAVHLYEKFIKPVLDGKSL